MNWRASAVRPTCSLKDPEPRRPDGSTLAWNSRQKWPQFSTPEINKKRNPADGELHWPRPPPRCRSASCRVLSSMPVTRVRIRSVSRRNSLNRSLRHVESLCTVTALPGLHHVLPVLGVRRQMPLWIPVDVADQPPGRSLVVGASAGKSASGRCSVPVNTRKPGGWMPKCRAMMASVSSSYLPPPMPWMNRSARQSRANSVVVSARVRTFMAVRFQALPAARRPRRPVGPASVHCRPAIASRRRRAGRTAAPRRWSAGVPRPERGFQPVAVPQQIGHRMVQAADAMPAAIVVDAVVVGRVEGRQVLRSVRRRTGRTLRSDTSGKSAIPSCGSPTAAPRPAGRPRTARRAAESARLAAIRPSRNLVRHRP